MWMRKWLLANTRREQQQRGRRLIVRWYHQGVEPGTVMNYSCTLSFACVQFHSGLSIVSIMYSLHAWHIVLCEKQQGGLRPPLLR